MMASLGQDDTLVLLVYAIYTSYIITQFTYIYIYICIYIYIYRVKGSLVGKHPIRSCIMNIECSIQCSRMW